MDKKVLEDLYIVAQGKGYRKSIDDFQTLLSQDEAVFNDMYGYAQSQGYKKSTTDFADLIGASDLLKKKVTASQQGQAVVTDTGKPASGPSPLASSVAPALEIESIGYQTSQFQDKEFQRRSTAVDRSVADFEASIPAYKQEQDVDRNAREAQQYITYLKERREAEEEHAANKQKALASGATSFSVFNYPEFSGGYRAKYADDGRSSREPKPIDNTDIGSPGFIMTYDQHQKEVRKGRKQYENFDFADQTERVAAITRNIANPVTKFVKEELQAMADEGSLRTAVDRKRKQYQQAVEQLKKNQEGRSGRAAISYASGQGAAVAAESGNVDADIESQRLIAVIQNLSENGVFNEEKAVASVAQDIFSQEFLPSYREKILELIPENRRTDAFLENLTDKIFYETNVNLDLDGDGRFNDQRWIDDLAVSVKSGINTVTNTIEYGMTYVLSLPEEEGRRSDLLEETRAKLREGTEAIQDRKTIFTSGIYDSIAAGDVSSAMRQTINATGEALPIIGLTMAGSALTGGSGTPFLLSALPGAFASGTVSGVNHYIQIRDLKDDLGNEIYGPDGALLSAFAVGTGEALFSMVGSGIAKGCWEYRRRLIATPSTRDVLNRTFREQFRGTQRELMLRYITGFAAKRFAAFTEEGATEMATGMFSEWVDSQILGTKFDFAKSFQSQLDALVTGGVVGVLFDGAGAPFRKGADHQAKVLAQSNFDGWYKANVSELDTEIQSLESKMKAGETDADVIQVAQQVDALKVEREKRIQGRKTELMSIAANDRASFNRLSKINADFHKEFAAYRGIIRSQVQKMADSREFASEADKKAFIESPSKETLAEAARAAKDVIAPISDRVKKLELERDAIMAAERLSDPDKVKALRDELTQQRAAELDKAISDARLELDKSIAGDDAFMDDLVSQGLSDQDVDSRMASRLQVQEENEQRIQALEGLKGALNTTSNELSKLYDDYEKAKAAKNKKLAKATLNLIVDKENELSDIAKLPIEPERMQVLQQLLAQVEQMSEDPQGDVPLRDAEWDNTFKSNLPQSTFQSIAQLSEVLSSGTWGMLTAENPMRSKLSDEENAERNARAKAWLESKGYKPQQIFGKYDNSESSFFVEGLTVEHALEFAKEFNQESVAHSDAMIYQDGTINRRTRQDATGSDPDNYYSTVNIGGQLVNFQVGYDFDNRFDKDGNRVEVPKEPDSDAARSAALTEMLGQTSSDSHDSYRPYKDGTFSVDWEKYGVTDPEIVRSLNNFLDRMMKSGVDVKGIVFLTGDNSVGVDRGLYDANSGVIAINIKKIQEEPLRDRDIEVYRDSDFLLQIVIQEEFAHSLSGAIIRSMPPEVRLKLLTDLIGIFKSNEGVMNAFVNKVGKYLDDVSPERIAKIKSIADKLDAAKGPDKAVFAMELANEISDLDVVAEESIQEISSYVVTSGAKIEAKGWPRFIAWLNDLRAKIGLPPSIDSDIKAIDYIKGMQRARAGYAAFRPGKGKKGATAESKSQPTPVIIPRRLRSLSGLSKKAYMEENPSAEFMSTNDLPDGPFEVTYTVNKEYVSRGKKQSYQETKTHKFNDRSHFINWWKKTNLHRDSSYGRTDKIKGYLGSSEVFPGKKDRFSMFTFNGKIIDTEGLEATHLKPEEVPFFRTKVDGPGTFAFNSLVTDLKAMYDDGLIDKNEYYGQLNVAKRSLDKIQQLETSDRNANYWIEVETLKRQHIRRLQSLTTSLKFTGTDAKFQPMSGFYGPATGERIPDFPTYTGFKNGVTGAGKFESRTWDILKNEPQRVNDKVKELYGQDFESLGKSAASNARYMAARILRAEDFIKNNSHALSDLTSTETQAAIFASMINEDLSVIRDMINSKDAGIPELPGKFQENYVRERRKAIDKMYKDHEIKRSPDSSDDVIYTLIDTVFSDGNLQNKNSKAALAMFRLVAEYRAKNGKWVIPERYIDIIPEISDNISGQRLQQIKNNITVINSAIEEHGGQIGKEAFNPNAFLAWAKGSSKDPKSSSLSNMQVLLARTAENESGAMGKLGAYFNFLTEGNKDLLVDTHNLQYLSLFRGVLNGSDYLPNGLIKPDSKEKLQKVAEAIDPNFKYKSDSDLFSFLQTEKAQAKIEANKGLKNQYCSAARECYQIQGISNKEAKMLQEVIQKSIPYLDQDILKDLGFADEQGNVRNIGISDINQLIYIIGQVGRKGATTPNATVLRSLSETGDIISSEAANNEISLIRNTKLTGERYIVELTGSKKKPVYLKNAQVLGDVTFTPNEDVISSVLDAKISVTNDAVSQSGTPKVIDQKTMQMIEIFTDPFSGKYPRTESGEMISKAETVVVKNGRTYVAGKLEVVPDEGNVNAPYSGESDLTADQKKDALENIKTVFNAQKLSLDPGKALSNMSAEGRKKAAENKFEARSGNQRLRRTVGRAASKMPGIKQDLLANPENYIAPQNLQAVKDNLENMSEQDLISMMRDDALGLLQNRNDDTGVMAGAELLNRAMQRGDAGAAKLLIEELAKMGTSAGRILRQFRELKLTTPKGMSDVIQKLIEGKGNTLTPEQKAKLDTITENMYKLRDEYNDLVKRSMAGEDLGAELSKVSNNMADVEKELNTMMNALYERGWGEIGKMLIQGNLLTPMSQTTNVGANMVNLFGDMFIDTISIPLERLLGMLGMNVEYKRGFSFMAYMHGFRAMGLAFVEAGKSAVTGKRMDQSTEWTQTRGFMPIQSLLSVLSKEDLPLNSKGVPSVSQRLKLATQASMGVPAEIMFRTLTFGDLPFRRFAEARELYRIGKSKGLSGEALKKFMQFPDKHSLDIAQRQGRKLTYQEKTSVSEYSRRAVEAAERLMSDGLRSAVGDKVVNPEEVSKFIIGAHIPYLMTPSNILHETMTYLSPIYATARIAAGIRRKDARAISENFGKMVVGSMLTSTAVLLLKEGLMSGPLDAGDDEEKNIAYDQFPPLSINRSGLMRYLNGGDPTYRPETDRCFGFSKLGIPGAIFGAVAKGVDRKALAAMDYDQMSFAHKAFMGYLGVSPMAGVSSVMDQSFMQGMETMLSTFTSMGERDFDQNVEKFMSTFFKAVTATALPNTLSAVHRAEREYMPDMRVTKDMTMSERAFQSFKYAVMDRTFNTDGIPIRVDWKGNKIKQTPTGADPFMYHLFDITKARNAEADKVSNEIWKLYESTGVLTSAVGTPNFAKKAAFNIPGDSSFRSKKARRAMESLSRDYTFLNDEEFTSSITYLNTVRLNELAEIAGKMRYRELQDLMATEEFSAMSDEEKVSAMDKVDSRYTHKIAMDGDVLMPHTIKILDYMQDDYESMDR
jgi:hypothetical protein